MLFILYDFSEKFVNEVKQYFTIFAELLHIKYKTCVKIVIKGCFSVFSIQSGHK